MEDHNRPRVAPALLLALTFGPAEDQPSFRPSPTKKSGYHTIFPCV
jgi:hypothetical protein